MRKNRTEQEKLYLIKKFKQSGLPLNLWCNTNHVPSTSMYTWIKKYDTNKSTVEETSESKATAKDEKIKFVEVKETTLNQRSVETRIQLECKDVKIYISNKKFQEMKYGKIASRNAKCSKS